MVMNEKTSDSGLPLSFRVGTGCCKDGKNDYRVGTAASSLPLGRTEEQKTELSFS
jgi:hypothetical protein